MSTFYLIRHGERETPPEMLPGRAAGVRLTERGRAQAERLVAQLKRQRIDQILSSPLERAVETAGPLARERKLSVQTTVAFTEVHFGVWTGKRVTELVASTPWRHFNQFRSGTRIPGGESAIEVQHRFVSELLRLRDAHPEEGIVCVSHADPIRLALTYFLGMPVDHFDRIEVAVGSVSILTIADWGARVLRMNDVAPE